MSDFYNEIYVGNKPGSEQIYTHAETINNKDIIIESAVLAGPVSFPYTITVTGTLAVV
jgi:hypothetical protein|tara:strand:- start:10 stop:183 length:174 start_codon:yes stop_codon:yes gene_type:complete